MGYSKIKSVELENFMVYKKAKVCFDESNILNIKGYNSGGKSTILKAIAVCLTNMYVRAQAKFIRHGEKYFRIVVNFDDGVSIVRVKYVTGQSLYEMYKDGQCILTTKEGNKLTKIDEIPSQIVNYLGLCVVSTGCLNYQVRQDPLWLIETTGSQNYNSLNEILKTEEVSVANAMLNSDKNKLNSDITGMEASLQEVQLSLVETKWYTEELLLALNQREEICKDLCLKYSELKKVYSESDSLSSIKSIPDIQGIDSKQYESILRVSSLIGELQGIKEIPEVSTLDSIGLGKIERLDKILSVARELERLGTNRVPDVSTVDCESYKDLLQIIQTVFELKGISDGINKLRDAEKKYRASVQKVVEKAEKAGLKFVKCTNCGTYMTVSR